jgi:hypothetical protein
MGEYCSHPSQTRLNLQGRSPIKYRQSKRQKGFIKKFSPPRSTWIKDKNNLTAEIAENAEDFRLKSKNLPPCHAGALACEKIIGNLLPAFRSLLYALCAFLLFRHPVEPVKLHGESAPPLG